MIKYSIYLVLAVAFCCLIADVACKDNKRIVNLINKRVKVAEYCERECSPYIGNLLDYTCAEACYNWRMNNYTLKHGSL